MFGTELTMTFEDFCIPGRDTPDRLHVHEGSMILYVRCAVMVRGGFVIADVQQEGGGLDTVDERLLDAAFRHFLVGQREHPERAIGIENPNDGVVGWLMRQPDWHLLHRPHEEATPFFGNSAWRARDRRFMAL